jgi:hypothetical protein
VKASLLLPLGLGLILVGLVWTAQGLGWLGGSPMTGKTLWAVLGPVLALVGAALVVTDVRRRR